MSGLGNAKSMRTLAGIVSVLLLIALLFSAFYVVAEADHDCSGEDCPICDCIQQCERILDQFCNGIFLSVSITIPLFSTALLVFSFLRIIMQDTLVARKVRLND